MQRARRSSGTSHRFAISVEHTQSTVFGGDARVHNFSTYTLSLTHVQGVPHSRADRRSVDRGERVCAAHRRDFEAVCCTSAVINRPFGEDGGQCSGWNPPNRNAGMDNMTRMLLSAGVAFRCDDRYSSMAVELARTPPRAIRMDNPQH